jgi:hypothetical protein
VKTNQSQFKPDERAEDLKEVVFASASRTFLVRAWTGLGTPGRANVPQPPELAFYGSPAVQPAIFCLKVAGNRGLGQNQPVGKLVLGSKPPLFTQSMEVAKWTESYWHPVIHGCE